MREKQFLILGARGVMFWAEENKQLCYCDTKNLAKTYSYNEARKYINKSKRNRIACGFGYITSYRMQRFEM